MDAHGVLDAVHPCSGRSSSPPPGWHSPGSGPARRPCCRNRADADDAPPAQARGWQSRSCGPASLDRGPAEPAPQARCQCGRASAEDGAGSWSVLMVIGYPGRPWASRGARGPVQADAHAGRAPAPSVSRRPPRARRPRRPASDFDERLHVVGFDRHDVNPRRQAERALRPKWIPSGSRRRGRDGPASVPSASNGTRTDVRWVWPVPHASTTSTRSSQSVRRAG